MSDRRAGHVQCVILADHDDNYAPPEKPVLVVAQVGDVVFLDLATVDERHDDLSLKMVARIGVKRSSLMNALDVVHKD